MPEVIDSISGEVVPGAMEDVWVDARIEKFRAAYVEATRASHASVAVRLLVSRDAWDFLMTSREPDAKPGYGWPAWTMMGIPVTCDTSSHQPEGFSIVVETRRIIP